MTLKSRLQKLINKLEPKANTIYFMGWKDCKWSAAEGLMRYRHESKDNFLSMLGQTPVKNGYGVIKANANI